MPPQVRGENADEKSMLVATHESVSDLSRLGDHAIDARIAQCGRLPSLDSINSALNKLLSNEDGYGTEVSDLIRRDPSLTARLLRLVNSVYFGLPSAVERIDEAVLYLGVRQIRQLAMVTPVIADFQKLTGDTPFHWKEFWRHCVGTALIASELTTSPEGEEDEVEYICGLVHDVGKIVMASVFPDHFVEIHQRMTPHRSLIELETDILGIDHAELGARYLSNQQLPETIVQATRYHHSPHEAGDFARSAAAVALGDLCIRSSGLGFSGNLTPASPESWRESSCWEQLGTDSAEEKHVLISRTTERMGRVNGMLDNILW